MAFIMKKKKYKFNVELTLEELTEVSYSKVILFAKIRQLDGGNFSDVSKRMEVQNHAVKYAARFTFLCKMNAAASSGVLETCKCRISIRMEEKGGRHFRKLGFVDVNLAEYAGAGPSTQRHILQPYESNHRLDNSIVQISLNITLKEGDTIFQRPLTRQMPISLPGEEARGSTSVMAINSASSTTSSSTNSGSPVMSANNVGSGSNLGATSTAPSAASSSSSSSSSATMSAKTSLTASSSGVLPVKEIVRIEDSTSTLGATADPAVGHTRQSLSATQAPEPTSNHGSLSNQQQLFLPEQRPEPATGKAANGVTTAGNVNNGHQSSSIPGSMPVPTPGLVPEGHSRQSSSGGESNHGCCGRETPPSRRPPCPDDEPDGVGFAASEDNHQSPATAAAVRTGLGRRLWTSVIIRSSVGASAGPLRQTRSSSRPLAAGVVVEAGHRQQGCCSSAPDSPEWVSYPTLFDMEDLSVAGSGSPRSAAVTGLPDDDDPQELLRMRHYRRSRHGGNYPQRLSRSRSWAKTAVSPPMTMTTTTMAGHRRCRSDFEPPDPSRAAELPYPWPGSLRNLSQGSADTGFYGSMEKEKRKREKGLVDGRVDCETVINEILEDVDLAPGARDGDEGETSGLQLFVGKDGSVTFDKSSSRAKEYRPVVIEGPR